MQSVVSTRGAAGPPVAGDPLPGLPTPPPPPPPPSSNGGTSGKRPIISAAPAPPPTALPAAAPPPISIDPDALAAFVADLKQTANTGSQGASVRSNAADIAARSDRISRILEKRLEEATRPGFGDIIASAMDTLAGQGKVSFAGALAQREGQELTRAYNIANALSGLQRRNQQQLVEVALPDGRKVMVPAGTALTQLTKQQRGLGDRVNFRLNELNDIYKDPVKAYQVFQEATARLAPYATTEADLRAKVAADEAVQALQRKPVEGAGGLGGPVIDANGDITRHAPYTASKGATLNAEQKNYNAALESRDFANAALIYYRSIGKPTSVLNAEQRRPWQNFVNQHVASIFSLGLIGKIQTIVAANPAALGKMGEVQSALNSGIQQVRNTLKAFATDPSNTDAQRNRADEAYDGILNPERYSKQLDAAIAAWNTGPNANTLRANGIDYAILRSHLVNLAYVMAQANEPGGRFATQDVVNAMNQIGGTQGDPLALLKLLKGVAGNTNDRMEALRRVTPYVHALQERWSPSLDVGTLQAQLTGERPLNRIGGAAGRAAPAAPSPQQRPTVRQFTFDATAGRLMEVPK